MPAPDVETQRTSCSSASTRLCDLIKVKELIALGTKLEATVAHRKSSLRSFLQRPHRITCPMHPSGVQAIARARISWANVNSIFSLPICDGGQVRLLTRCVLSLTSSHAPHPSASTATKYCTFPCACPPTLRAHGIRPARACAPPLALSLCTTLCTHHLSLFVSFPDRSECELYNEVRYSVWHAGFPIENDSKRYENSFFFRCAGQNDACSKVNFAAVQPTPSRGFSQGPRS